MPSEGRKSTSLKAGTEKAGKGKKRVHLVCNAHIDPVWQWTREEGIAAAISTFESAVRLSKEYDYIFCHNESFLYEYTEEYAPGLFAEIRALIKAGRWHVMGGWYLQPDCNMPCGESIVRQIEIGRRYFFEKFGVRPAVAVNVDPFGHSRGLVQILKKCGYSGYIVGRPGRASLPLPSEEFIWKGFDGSTVKVCRIEKYATLMGHAAEHIEKSEDCCKEELALVFWGLGNHGGGPSRKDLEDVEDRSRLGKEWLHSTPERFFAEISPEVVWEKPLTHVFPGCYSSMAGIKQAHSLLESRLYATEAICSVAALSGLTEYPGETLDGVQKDLLQLEFHDVLAGTCTKTCEEASLRLAAHGLEELGRAFDRAFFSLVNGEEPAAEGEYPLFVFNPLPYEVRTCVEAEFTLCPTNDGENDDSLVFVSEKSGKRLRAQIVKEESNLNWDCRKRVAFAGTLAPMGITRFTLTTQKIEKKRKIRAVTPVEREGYYAAVNPENGALERFASEGVELLSGGILPVMYDDNPDPWAMSGKQALHIGENPRPFAFASRPCGAFCADEGCRCIESGGIYEKIESFFQKENTFVRIVYTLYKSLPYIDLDLTVQFNASDRAIKLAIPVAFEGEFFGQTAFGKERLEHGRECVAQRFVTVERGDGTAFILLNRGSYAFSYENGRLFVTLLRGATCCAHPIGDRELIPHDRYTEKIDQGERRFSFRILYGKADCAERYANEFCRVPYALNVFPAQRGKRADKLAFALSDPQITLSSFRRREDGYLIRLFNPTDKTREARLDCGKASLSVRLCAFEVKTLVYANGGLAEKENMIL